MKKLLSLPPNLVARDAEGHTLFHSITQYDSEEYFCSCDPVGHRIGSGGGTAWLIDEAKRAGESLSGKNIVIHAGGQSRRLPAYAPSGKILTPLPVFRWERGQRLNQCLLDLQLPLFEQIMQKAPDRLRTMIVSGDVLIRATEPLQPIPEADVVCYGLWLHASIAKDHGVFVSHRSSPHELKMMLQKPTLEELNALQGTHYYLTDIGIWLLSDRALDLLRRRSMNASEPPSPEEATASGYRYYDLYSDFGRALGTDPSIVDAELNSLKVAILPLPGGEFYHFGTSREMISSTLEVQNLVNDQREIMHHDRKPHPSIFVQNALIDQPFTQKNSNVWVENSHLAAGWELSHDHVITGVPRNDWHVKLLPGDCIDVVPIGESDYALRYYTIDDRFDGMKQQEKLFPVIESHELSKLNNYDWTTFPEDIEGKEWLSAEELSARANLKRLFAQREEYRSANWPMLARNWEHSVFYQLDLDNAAKEFATHHIAMPEPLPESAPLMTRIHDAMFRNEPEKAFRLLGEGLTERALREKQKPEKAVYNDQIVWARSPVRIDLAGGWTDTPPYCLMEGGNVVNIAIELNGQPPLQTYIRPSAEPRIVLRSIDIGASEVIESYEQLAEYNKVGSPFSIPKAALALAGFLPQFCKEHYTSLKQQLQDFGCGIELTLLSAIPAGSGLGTSSILAATVLGAVSDFCSLAWDKNEIGHRTLVLEQMLTTGGGWQDQFGGILPGAKLLQTSRGFDQQPLTRWLPSHLFTHPDYRDCHLLYYTGITRTAKQILGEIVRRMFLNNHEELLLLREMREHAMIMYDAIQRHDFLLMGRLVARTWQQNQLIDSGTNPQQVEAITRLIDDLCLGYKLPGAGGGGYLYMVAKDPEAAMRIRHIIGQNRQNANARFVDMSLSQAGLQISRS